MGKDELKVIAAELVTQVRKSVTIDWTVREGAWVKIKVLVKRIEIRSLPALTQCFSRSFTFYVAHPARSIL